MAATAPATRAASLPVRNAGTPPFALALAVAELDELLEVVGDADEGAGVVVEEVDLDADDEVEDDTLELLDLEEEDDSVDEAEDDGTDADEEDEATLEEVLDAATEEEVDPEAEDVEPEAEEVDPETLESPVAVEPVMAKRSL